MREHVCEYIENGAPARVVGPLAVIHRRVGSLHVTLDGVDGRFEHGEDEHAAPIFLRDPPRPEVA